MDGLLRPHYMPSTSVEAVRRTIPLTEQVLNLASRPDHRLNQPFWPKCFSNSSRARTIPSFVSATDLAFDFGSEINPFAYSRSSAPQSCDFQARAPYSSTS